MPCLQTRVDNLERSVGINGEGVTTVLGLGRDPFNYGLISRNCKDDNQSCQKKKKGQMAVFLLRDKVRGVVKVFQFRKRTGSVSFFGSRTVHGVWEFQKRVILYEGGICVY